MNCQQWYGEDPTCALCPSPATLKHIMTGCKNSLTQDRYTWRHNQVLKILALESKQTPITTSTKSESGKLCLARDWKMLADIGQQLIVQPEIALTILRPDF